MCQGCGATLFVLEVSRFSCRYEHGRLNFVSRPFPVHSTSSMPQAAEAFVFLLWIQGELCSSRQLLFGPDQTESWHSLFLLNQFQDPFFLCLEHSESSRMLGGGTGGAQGRGFGSLQWKLGFGGAETLQPWNRGLWWGWW